MQENNLFLAPEHVSGFVSGEGCFYVESGYDRKYRLKHRIRPAFCIEVRADDREILEAIRKIIGCGNIYELDFGRYRGYESKGWKPHVKYRVSNFLDIKEKVVPFFRRYPPFGKKRMAFGIFCEVVEAMNKRQHLSEETLGFLKEKVKLLNALNKKGA
jgi:hypothetical protein